MKAAKQEMNPASSTARLARQTMPLCKMGKPAIVFSGENNGRMNIVAVVSDKRLDLFVQTAYVSVKKGNIATPTGEQAPINTPEANSSTVSNKRLSQPDADAKQNVHNDSMC